MTEPTTAAGRKLASDMRLLYQGVPLILGKPDDIVAKVEAEARAAALEEVEAHLWRMFNEQGWRLKAGDGISDLPPLAAIDALRSSDVP